MAFTMRSSTPFRAVRVICSEEHFGQTWGLSAMPRRIPTASISPTAGGLLAPDSVPAAHVIEAIVDLPPVLASERVTAVGAGNQRLRQEHARTVAWSAF